MKRYTKSLNFFSITLFLCISILGFSQTSTAPYFHDTKGNIEVSKSGQLEFTVPIEVPQGIKNLAPDINIVYSSGSGNGVVGYGGSISGLTAISRVGKTIERDTISKGVQLDYSDYYSFNGQRLILKSGEYGKDGAEYVTENYSNIKIKSIGAITGQSWKGPEYWEVTFDNGSQAWYGATTSGDSEGRTILDYNIVKLRDVDGNYITYNYDESGNTTTIRNIEWGGNDILNKPHFNRIDFNYSYRSNAEKAWIKGQLLSQWYLLESIVVSSKSSQFKKYVITYKKDLQETGYRYIDKIQVLNSNNEYANPIVFNYERSMEFQVNPAVNTWHYGDMYKLDSDYDLSGDFDGDGKLDIIRYFATTAPGITQAGLYLLKNAFSASGEKVYLGAPFTKADLKTGIAINYKKSNIIYNKQGFVIYKKVNNQNTSKKDLELSFYTVAEDNTLVLDFKKTIPDIETFNLFEEPLKTTATTTSTILGIDSFDFNGDGLSELILQMNYRVCIGGSTDPSGPVLQGDNILPGGECNNYKKYIAIDLDENIQGEDWHYSLNFYDDDYQKYKSGDFNGDGLIDFLRIDNTKKTYLITFQKSAEGRYYPSTNLYSNYVEGLWDLGVVGDFNGDGLNDLFIPKDLDSDLWYIYSSTGDNFNLDVKSFAQPWPNRTISQGSNQSFGITNPRQFLAYDINNDGKTELVLLWSSRSYIKELQQDNNQSTKYGRSMSAGMRVLSNFGGGKEPYSWYVSNSMYLNSENIDAELAPRMSDYVGMRLNYQAASMMKQAFMAALAPFPDTPYFEATLTHPYYDIAKEGRVVGITQGGVTTTIIYKELDKNLNPGLYNSTKSENFPYIEFTRASKMFVVSQIIRTVGEKTLKQDYRYRGLVSHILGKGMIGFRQTASSSWYSEGFESTKIWSGVEIDPLNNGIPTKEWSIRTNNESNIFPVDLSESNNQLLTFKSSIYQIEKLLNGQPVTNISNADKAKVVTVIVPKLTRTKDFLTNVISENTIDYGQYYLPSQNQSKVNNSYAVKTSNYEYTNNPSGTGANYHIGRLIKKTETANAYNDVKNSNEEYTYEYNHVKTVKKWNSDNTGYLLDTYGYDEFGNINQKITTNSIDAQSVSSSFLYDLTGRFVETKTDNLGLQVKTVYDNFGQILTKKDPFDNTVTNTYDNWGKLLTSASTLGGTSNYVYTKDNNYNVTVTQTDEDGNISKTLTNKFGQVYKITTKAFGQGKYISKETKYDILGRKTSESEPYFDDQSASVWNVISYDDSVFPTKVTTTMLASLDTSGNVSSFIGKRTITSISGSTTTINEINNYNKITSKTTDALGNVISTTDKGGTIQFSYNAAGNQIQANYGGNSVTTKYDVWGRRSELSDPSNGIYKYEYDVFGREKKIISPKGEKSYTYNNLGQLITQNEFSTIDGGQTTNKTISFTYNSKGLITLKSSTISGQPFSVASTYDSHGRLLSLVENSFGKTYSKKGLVYDDKGRIESYEKELISYGVATNIVIENVYSTWNGELYQIKEKNSGKILWELKETDDKGQILKAKLGAVNMENSYDPSGFLSVSNQSSSVKQNFLKLTYSFDSVKNELKSRKTEGDFFIEELFDYDDNNRLVNWTNPITGVKPYVNRNVYDVKGRILENDQVGIVKFENSSKIYQPTGMTLNSEGSQNYNGDLIQTITYNENNDPVQISGERARVKFDYGMEGMRQRVDITKPKQIFGGGGGEGPPATEFSVAEGSDFDAPVWQLKLSKFYNEDNSFEVVRNQSTNQEKLIIYVEGSPYDSEIVYIKDFGATNGSYKFLHKDYLGSILAVSDEEGNKIEQRHFDAWGNFTHLQIGNSPVTTDKSLITSTLLVLDRGYTSHEHFLDVGIVHMNGRLYDPLLRRFLNADENIQTPTNTQNYNKYGYVMNNPMLYKDPNGEFWWWVAGAIAGGYFNGVQANGSWNPGKWNWEKTWSAVLGGAIGGAAIGGTLGNITSSPGAIKTVLPGIISGGLNSAFSGSNFFAGALSSISDSEGLYYTRTISNEVGSSTSTGTDFYDILYYDMIFRGEDAAILFRQQLSKKYKLDGTPDFSQENLKKMISSVDELTRLYELSGKISVFRPITYLPGDRIDVPSVTLGETFGNVAYLSVTAIQNNLDLALTLGHEMIHVYHNLKFRRQWMDFYRDTSGKRASAISEVEAHNWSKIMGDRSADANLEFYNKKLLKFNIIYQPKKLW